MEVFTKIRERFYAIDPDEQTYYRIGRPDGIVESEWPAEEWCSDADLLLCSRYWRPDLTIAQNLAANNIGETPEGLRGDVNVAMTTIRIMKEREFLQAVAAGDEDALAEIERDERAAAMLAEEFGGHCVGSAVFVEAA